jgi:hypothetical protein
MFAAGAADAPLAIENDKLAAPNAGRALLLRFRLVGCFARDMADTSHTFAQCSDQSITTAIHGTVLGSSSSRCGKSTARRVAILATYGGARGWVGNGREHRALMAAGGTAHTLP